MAYGVKRYGEFRDDFGQDWKIEILKEGYTGSSSSFTLGPAGFNVKYAGEGDPITASIKASELSFVFYSQSTDDDNFIKDIAETDQTDYAVRVWKNITAGPATVYWVGNLILDSAMLADLYYPQQITLRAIDGLSQLKTFTCEELTDLLDVQDGATEDFTAVPGEFWGGQMYSFMNLMTRALALLPTSSLWGGTDTFVRSMYNWHETSMASSNTDPMYWCALQSSIFYKENDAEEIQYSSLDKVIEDILTIFNARIFMGNGEWNIVQVNTYKWLAGTGSADQTYTRYSKSGSTLGYGTTSTPLISEITAATSPFRRAEMTNTFAPPIKKIRTATKPPSFDYTVPGDEVPDYNAINKGGHQLNGDPTPVTADWKNTFVAGATAADGYTFTIQFQYMGQCNIGLADLPGLYEGSYYFLSVVPMIKCGVNYLYHDWADDKAKWSTSEQPYSAAVNTVYMQYDYPSQSFANQIITIGSDSLDEMEELLTTDNIEYYVYYRIIKWSDETGYIDVTADFDEADHTMLLNSNDGGLSWSSRLILWDNGVNVTSFDTTIQNSPSGVPIEGGVLIEDEVIVRNEDFYTGDQDLLVGDGSGWGLNNWQPKEILWTNTNPTAAITPQKLIVLRGIDSIAMQAESTKILQGNILRTDAYSTTDVCDFTKCLEYDGDIYVANGLTFSARSGITSGEWQKVAYDSGNALGSANIATLLYEWMNETWYGGTSMGGFDFGWF